MASSSLLNRAFFGKDNCLKVTLNKNLDCYFEFGRSGSDGWQWFPVKFNDVELAKMLLVLNGTLPSVSFFHNFKGDTRQIWIAKKQSFISFKIKEVSKGLDVGEQTVLIELLRHIIVRMNLTF